VLRRSREEPPPQARLAGAGGRTAPVESGGGEAAGPSEGLILVLFVVVTLAATAWVLKGAVHDAVHNPTERAARGEIRPLDGSSLLREKNLRRLLASVASGRRSLVTSIAVRPDRATVTVRDAGGSRSVLTYDAALKKNENDAGVGTDDALAATKLDPAGPERMIRAVAERTGLGADAADYVATSPVGLGEPTWYLFLKRGSARQREWAAAMDGSDLRHPGDPSRRERARKAKRQSCLRKAAGDATATFRCLDRYSP
jgi:hypothetical protein